MANPGTITLRELNRATLARQHLLGRRRLGVAAAVESLGAIQSQHPEWPPVALGSRLTDFRREALERAYARRSVVRAGLQRMTLHVVTAGDFWPLWHLTHPIRLDQWRLMTKLDPSDRRIAESLEAACTAAVDALTERPLRRDEFTKVLEQHAPAELRELPHRGLSRYFMAVQPLVQVAERGEIYGRGRYVTAGRWLGPAPDTARDLDAARQLVIRRHLAAFGPASLADTISWIGKAFGGIGAWRAALAAIGDDLVQLKGEDGEVLWDLAGAPRPGADPAAPPRLLARWDSILLAHGSKRRGRILPPRHQSSVFTKNADVLPTILVDGMVAGTWLPTRHDGTVRIVIRPFDRLPSSTREALAAEAHTLARVIAPDAATPEVEFA